LIRARRATHLAVVGGWLDVQVEFGSTQGFTSAPALATPGAILVRIVLRAIETR
jgi:hypothetical protein